MEREDHPSGLRQAGPCINRAVWVIDLFVLPDLCEFGVAVDAVLRDSPNVLAYLNTGEFALAHLQDISTSTQG